MDRVPDTVYRQSCKWRYDPNADKRAILVNGTDTNESKSNEVLY